MPHPAEVFSRVLLPVSSQINTANAKIVTATHESRLQLKSPSVGSNSLLRAISVG